MGSGVVGKIILKQVTVETWDSKVGIPATIKFQILEVAGTALTTADIIQMELRWKSKLQSREMGLNRN